MTQTCEPTHPIDLGLGSPSISKIWYFYREFAENLQQKVVQYAIKIVIYKRLGKPDPIHPHLGQLSQIYQGIFWMLPLLRVH